MIDENAKEKDEKEVGKGKNEAKKSWHLMSSDNDHLLSERINTRFKIRLLTQYYPPSKLEPLKYFSSLQFQHLPPSKFS